MPDLNEQMRAEFEAWYRATAPEGLRWPAEYTECKLDNGDYAQDWMQRMWMGWQAARRQHGSAAPDALDMQTIRERDEYQETADELAFAVAEHFGADIGEHSSANCPWSNALDLLNTKPEFIKCAGSGHGSAAQAVAVVCGADGVPHPMPMWLGNTLPAIGTRLFAAPPVADAEGVKPWQERFNDRCVAMERGFSEASCMQEEIADLRAGLSRLNGEKK